jgi:aminoglycoside phosphotransferase (APT) family kinase protein
MGLIDTGWDSRAWIVDDKWLDREPRRAEVTDRLRAEVRLMTWLAPQLPVPVPEPTIVRDEPLRVRHRLLVGEPLEHGSPTIGTAMGAFLRALHAVSSADAERHGALDADAARDVLSGEIGRMRQEVLPLLDDGAAAQGARLLGAAAAPPPSLALAHADLGPEHILVADGAVAGVIDWTDARVTDPAIDLAWLLNGAPTRVAAAVAEAYGVDDSMRRRAYAWHQLGPWHEVLYGIDTGEDGYVRSGLAGVRRRLATAAP